MASHFVPGPVSGVMQTYTYQPNPRYQVRPEWVVCADKIRRIRYRAYYDNCTIGEIVPSFRREGVIEDLQELIDAGGVGAMKDLSGDGDPDE